MKKKGNNVYWDIYGIINNPSTEALEKELKKLSDIQLKRVNSDISVTNSELTQRQNRINILKKELGKQNIMKVTGV